MPLRSGWLLAASVALLGVSGPPPATPPDPLPLAWCLERAEVANPGLDVARTSAEAAEARIYPAGALPDPRFRYELSNIPVDDFDLDSTPLSGQQLGLNQRFPFPGLLGGQRDAARSASEASQEGVGDESRRVAAAAERAWVELGFAQRALEVTIENTDLLRQLAKIAEAKYRVGVGLQQDVIREQVALTELLDEQLRRQAAIRSAEARLANLLDLPPETPLPRTESVRETAPLPDLSHPHLRFKELFSILVEGRLPLTKAHRCIVVERKRSSSLSCSSPVRALTMRCGSGSVG